MKRFIEQEAQEKAEEIMIKVSVYQAGHALWVMVVGVWSCWWLIGRGEPSLACLRSHEMCFNIECKAPFKSYVASMGVIVCHLTHNAPHTPSHVSTCMREHVFTCMREHACMYMYSHAQQGFKGTRDSPPPPNVACSNPTSCMNLHRLRKSSTLRKGDCSRTRREKWLTSTRGRKSNWNFRRRCEYIL